MKRTQLPESLKDVLTVSKFVTLYLLKKFDPTKFLLSDPLGNEHLVQIGQKLSCSCLPGNKDHCMHTFYVLLRIYKLDPSDPIVFQKSYSQNDIKYILSFEEKIKKQKEKEENTTFQMKKEEAKSQKVIQKQTKKQQRKYQQTLQEKNQVKQIQKKEWPTLQQGILCSICYDQVQNDTPIMNCLECKNYFHTKCLKVWIKHKRQSQSVSSCPMCRSEFQNKVEDRLKEQEVFFIKYHQSFEIHCSECQTQILRKIFKCLLCQQAYLCQKCYFGWLHKNHDKFLGKLSKKSDWTVTTRSQFNMEKLNASLEYLKKYGHKQKGDIKVLMGPNYEKFIEQQTKKVSIIEHIVESLLSVQKQVHKTYKKLQFSENELICCICRKKKIISLRRMPCKHFIDEKCLNFLLKNKLKQCPLDKSYILPGLSGIQLKA